MAKNGNFVRWYGSGQKQIQGNYVDDNLEGLVTVWNDNGEIEKTVQYRGGAIVSSEPED